MDDYSPSIDVDDGQGNTITSGGFGDDADTWTDSGEDRAGDAASAFKSVAAKKMIPGILSAMFGGVLGGLGIGAGVLKGLRKDRSIGDAITDAMKEKGFTDAEIAGARSQVAAELSQVQEFSGLGDGDALNMSLTDISAQTGEDVPSSLKQSIAEGGTEFDTNTEISALLSGGGVPYDDGGAGVAIKALQTQMMSTVSALGEIGEIRDIAMVTGGLNADQEAYISTIEKNSINQLTKTITEQTADHFESTLANLIDKGVLQGDVGQITINKLYESAQDAISEGSTEILNTGLAQRLSIMEANTDRQLKADIANQQADVDRAKLGLTSDQMKLSGMTDIAKVGIESAKIDQGTYGDYLNFLGTTRGQDMGADTKMGIAEMEKDSQDDANLWNAAGNIGSTLIKSLWSS